MEKIIIFNEKIMNLFIAYKTAKSVYELVKLFVTDIYDQLDRVYVDMAEAHFLSAKQSIAAYENSNDPNAEMRSV